MEDIVLNLTSSISWNIGAGFGLTNESDNVVFKSNLAFDIKLYDHRSVSKNPSITLLTKIVIAFSSQTSWLLLQKLYMPLL